MTVALADCVGSAAEVAVTVTVTGGGVGSVWLLGAAKRPMTTPGNALPESIVLAHDTFGRHKESTVVLQVTLILDVPATFARNS